LWNFISDKTFCCGSKEKKSFEVLPENIFCNLKVSKSQEENNAFILLKRTLKSKSQTYLLKYVYVNVSRYVYLVTQTEKRRYIFVKGVLASILFENINQVGMFESLTNMSEINSNNSVQPTLGWNKIATPAAHIKAF
jgi:hypothetical protein